MHCGATGRMFLGVDILGKCGEIIEDNLQYEIMKLRFVSRWVEGIYKLLDSQFLGLRYKFSHSSHSLLPYLTHLTNFISSHPLHLTLRMYLSIFPLILISLTSISATPISNLNFNNTISFTCALQDPTYSQPIWGACCENHPNAQWQPDCMYYFRTLN